MDFVFSTTWLNVLAIVSATILGMFLLSKFTQVCWKAVDLIALTVGAFALLAPIFEAEKQTQLIQSNNYVGWTKGELAGLKIATSTMLINCNSFIRSEFSPPDFDTLVLEQRKVCDWSKGLNSFVDTLSAENYRAIPVSYFDTFPDIREVPVGYKKDAFTKIMHEWNSFIKTRRKIDDAAQSATPLFIVFLAPYLLAFSFALAVSGTLFKARSS